VESANLPTPQIEDIIGVAPSLASCHWSNGVYYTQHLGNHCGCVFSVIRHHIRYPKLSFGEVYTACVGNLLYRVSHKMIPLCCFVGKLQKLRNFDTQAADIRRTF